MKVPVILVLHAGLDDGSQWKKVARLLAPRFRVEVPCRPQYRPGRGPAVSMADEAADAVARAERFGEPVLLVGHSSGAVTALEAMLLAPFAGAVLYEPPIVVGSSLGGEATARSRAAIDAGRPGKAMEIFIRDVVRVPAWQARVGGLIIGLVPRYRALASRQIDDLEAIEALGDRLAAYRAITVPTVLLGGDRSPAHLGERLDELGRVLPDSTRVVIHGQGHSANAKAPGRVAEIIAGHAARVLT